MQFLIQNTMFVDWFIYSLPWGRVGELDKASICDRGLIIKILKKYDLLWFLSVFFFFFLSIPVELRNTFLFVLETKPSSN
jgi:hypothetical protein